ncbi:mitochondrial ribosomal protein S10 [Osmia lignaria lignaria]|uniref:mitochondrial ribosomal protein S10 n=1 Tax=Osmia lignaria lignaria TaxID=1437193 RepID=UPI0014787FB9|nr:28S ribosomal protein S10, mitochondrial [Osmia lignaria]
MFRSKMLLIVQNTINNNVYNSGRASIYALFSSNTSNVNLSETATENLNKNVSEASTEILKEALTKTSNKESTNTPTEASSTSTSSFEESSVDKLYKTITVEVRGNDPAVLNSYTTFSHMAATHLDIPIIKLQSPRKPIHQRLTLLKSVHVHKKHRVQYETRTYYRYFELSNLTGSTADTYLEYIQRNLPEGVAMKVTKAELHTLPESVQQASFQ